MFFDETQFFSLWAYFTCRNVFLLSCGVYLNHHFTYTLLLRSHTYMTIVGLDFCPPSDAAERVVLYHRAYTRITPISLDIYEDNTHIKPSIGHTNNTGTHMCIFVRIVGLSITFMVECMFF